MASSFRRPVQFLFKLSLPIVGLLLASSGCAENKPAAPVRPAAASSSAPAQTAALRNKQDSDHGCSYFYFLWGRHAELASKYDAALEAYEKALICDPDANFVISKLPALLVRMNRRDEAAARLRDYLRHHPAAAEPRMQLAKLLIDAGKLQEAADQYRQAHELNPKETAPLLLLSELHLSENKPEEAEAALQEVLAADSRSYPAHLLLARLLAEQGQLAQAVEHYEQAVSLNASEGLQLELADVLIEQKKYAQAASICKDLLKQDEQSEEARIGLIHTCLLRNNERQAMAELKRLNDLTGNPEQADLTLVKLHIRWEEYGKAIVLLQKMLKKEQELSEARYLLGALQVQKKQYQDALQTLAQIDPEADEHEDALILQVRVFKELGREDEAARRLEAALGKDSQLSPEVWLLLIGIYQAAEQDAACRKTFARALENYPDNERLLYDYGLFLNESGRRQQALASMNKLLQLNPDHAGALNYIGYTWAESKTNLSKAFLYLTRAGELKPDNPSIHDSLGWVYYQMGSLDNAVRTLQEAAAMAPDDPAVHEHLAEALAAAGQRAEAEKAWRKALELHSAEAAAAMGKRKQEQAESGVRRVKGKLARLDEKEKQ
jgi:tetratricopeptide (TPR) repeat protein